MNDPEISMGKGASQTVLKGKGAIRAAGWTVPYFLFAHATYKLTLAAVGLSSLVWLWLR